MIISSRLSGDERRLCNQERPRNRSSLRVVFDHEGRRDVLLGGAVPRERGHYDAVRQGQIADLSGREELGLRHGWLNEMKVWKGLRKTVVTDYGYICHTCVTIPTLVMSSRLGTNIWVLTCLE